MEKVYLTKYDGRANQSFQVYLISPIVMAGLIKPKNGKIWSEIDISEAIQ